MKKILFTTPNFNTAGSGKVVLDLVKGLKNDFQVEVACFHNKGELFKVVEKEAHKTHLFPFAIKAKPYWSLFSRTKSIREFFKTNQFDLIHSWHYTDDWTEGLSSRLAGVPYVITKKSMSWGGKDWWLRSKLSSHVITINQDMNREFYPNWKNAEYMPLGLDIEEYSPLKKDRGALNGLPITEDDFVLTSVANMVPVKGIETALLALSTLKNKQIKYVLVGSVQPDYKEKLDQIIAENDLTNQVFFVGKKDNVKPYLAATDLFVIPTLNKGRKEGQPMAPVEAMACARLVAGSKIPGVKDILQNFTDFIFEAEDYHGLAKIINQTVNLTAERRFELANRMRVWVEENYSMTHFIQNHKALYNRLTG